ncbi:4-carboxy-4-hydroxy-2-oxoadipate aldolase/oxaloacetate decarboxylase [Leucobacter tardus]|uniref:Putative 4-hydroxy-4-methyl-2-oxoglutarate aldolase n=1 Tax=Leucobacter tardus TaxID=501483 RepID=A0A939QDU0_9MICO|nr:4-carboxy-4-hydroxy-2-oxoadipate aldolase/oxaloacetate decarboxylase [Leucobacter tardus]MBO2989035.1 4-carboxy-4-hydroxy-2-oxoadipate aldolase/oxaloacetate decarboxylase [Leucobacter tardus]
MTATPAPAEGVGRTGVVVTDIARADAATIDALGVHGVATVHEALGREGLVGHGVTPRQRDARIAGSAVTVLCWPGDNLMIHAAIEQCEPGDVLVVTTTSPSLDGAFGDLFATALHARGVRGIVTTTGVRDTADLRDLDFPVWSGAVHAQGTVKATAGSVNVPIIVEGALIRPGDVIVADDDGVVCVPRALAGATLQAADQRAEKEEADRRAYAEGALSLDRKGLRTLLADLGVRTLTQAEFEGSAPR